MAGAPGRLGGLGHIGRPAMNQRPVCGAHHPERDLKCTLKGHPATLQHLTVAYEGPIPRVVRWDGDRRITVEDGERVLVDSFLIHGASSEASAIRLLQEHPDFPASIAWSVVNGMGGWVGTLRRKVGSA